MKEFKIDPEFRYILSPLPQSTYNALKADIKDHGLLNPICVWQEEQTILDGHHRYLICQELGLPLKDDKIRYISLKSRGEAERWIMLQQFRQRNLNPKASSYSRGVYYDSLKGERGGDQKSKGKNEINAKEETAKKFGISERTVINDHKFFVSVEKLEKVLGEVAKENLINGKWRFSLKELQRFSEQVELLAQSNSMPPKENQEEDD